jgi:hypothetical protein
MKPIQQTAIKAQCPSCKKVLDVNLLSVASLITNYGCQECRDKDFEKGDEPMAKAVIKKDPKTEKKAAVKTTDKTPKLVKKDGEHPAVKEALDAKIAVQEKLEGMEEPGQVIDAQIEAWAIECKKVDKAKVALQNKSTELRDLIRGRMDELGVKHYRNGDLVEIKIKPVKETLEITINSDEEK